MRQDQKFEIERAFDLIPHVIGSSWAVTWFRFTGVKCPTREQYRKRVAMYMSMLEPLLKEFATDERLGGIHEYIRRRGREEVERVLAGRNKEVEKRYDRYIDYG